MTTYYEGPTDYAVPTGEFITEWLDDHEVSQGELAQQMGMSRKHVNRVIAGAPLTPDFANRLQLVTGVPAARWLALEGTYRADIERLGQEEELASRTDLLDQLAKSSAYLRKHQIVTATRRKPGILLREIMAFFGVGDADQLSLQLQKPVAAFRQSEAHRIDVASVATWLRMGELEAMDEFPNAKEYSESRLRESLEDIRSLSRSTNYPEILSARLAELGVILVAVPEVEGCRAYGATRWLRKHPIIQLSLRGKNDGQFWFTLFHELGHVLLHPRDQLFVEGIDGKDSEFERQANDFAQETLIPSIFDPDLSLLTSKDDVITFAEQIGVSPGIVVGRLHRRELWPPTHGQSLFVRLNFVD
ncbi:ImmA/IrrE family metallo-endopeptidase [Jiangella gansuensis]|uniref:ImmA/IrrE family metallo-endopeptidase n=1 Tax=Jiangella gansuensis TaxID=281473 RepID=UPI00047975BE|nr:ImmA/IrrE family metallo-endopeptidase [Jiangella gansuensis]